MAITGKQFVKILFAVLIIGIIVHFSIIKGPNGYTIKPLPSIKQDLKLSWYEIKFKYQALKGETLNSELARTFIEPETKTTQLYRWRDKNGNLSYGDAPHPTFGGEAIGVKPTNTIENFDSALTQEQDSN